MKTIGPLSCFIKSLLCLFPDLFCFQYFEAGTKWPIFSSKRCLCLDPNITKFIPKSQFDNKSALIQVLAWIYIILGGMLLIYQNATVREDEAWIKIYYASCSKHIALLAALIWFPAGSRGATRGACICETPLSSSHITVVKPCNNQMLESC